MKKAQAPAGRDAAQHPIKPTAPAARASGGGTRLEASLLAEGLFPHSARRVMLTVGRFHSQHHKELNLEETIRTVRTFLQTGSKSALFVSGSLAFPSCLLEQNHRR